MLTAAQRTLVQITFSSIAPIAAARFYRRLFEIDPALERMFKGDLAEQRRK